MKLGEQAKQSANVKGLDKALLVKALQKAGMISTKNQANDKEYASSIFQLRKAIRDLKGTPEAASSYINRFPTDPLF